VEGNVPSPSVKGKISVRGGKERRRKEILGRKKNRVGQEPEEHMGVRSELRGGLGLGLIKDSRRRRERKNR